MTQKRMCSDYEEEEEEEKEEGELVLLNFL